MRIDSREPQLPHRLPPTWVVFGIPGKDTALEFLTNYEGLDTNHLAELNAMSAIGEKQIRSRNYQSVTADKLPPQFADYQRRDGLLIPIRTVRGKIESFQLKPNVPRIGKNGKPIKYETAANAPQVIDVPAAAQTHLGDPNWPLVITEGAKKVDAAISAGLVSTIGLQGVYGWRGKNEHGGSTALADWEQIALNGREVLIAFDSDVMTKPSVRDALDRLAAFLRSKKAIPSYLLLPDLDDGAKCGLDDWFALHPGSNGDELNHYIVDHLPALTSLSSPAKDSASGDASGATSSTVGIPTLRTRYMHEVETKEIDWLWPNWLPKGMFSLLGGYAGDGKSTLSIAIAAALSRGTQLPDGATAPITKTLLVLSEDDVSHVVKGRLEVHRADPGKVITLDDVAIGDGNTRAFNLRTDVPLLRQEVEKHGIGLIVIDPLSSVMANGDRNSEGDVRDTLTPLVQMAEETGVCVLGIMHIGKTDGQARAMQKLMGSTAYTALARSVLMVQELPGEFQFPDQPTRKMLGVVKSNYAVAPRAISFSRPQDAALEFHGDSPVGIEESFNWKSKSEKSVSETDKAEDWLLAFMDGKPMAAQAVTSSAKEEGFSEPTLRRARKNLGITTRREGDGWMWLPKVKETA